MYNTTIRYSDSVEKKKKSVIAHTQLNCSFGTDCKAIGLSFQRRIGRLLTLSRSVRTCEKARIQVYRSKHEQTNLSILYY